MRKLKGFTLVEILIVIVIIGILIGALVPRMSAAQGRARDVARKNDLSNLQAAIVVAYQDLGRYPCTNEGGCSNGDEVTAGGTKASAGLDISTLKSKLEAAGMNTVPKDPLGTNTVMGLGTSSAAAGDYRYLTVESHGIPDGGFVLMAKTEVAGSSNWVTCAGTDDVVVECAASETDDCVCTEEEPDKKCTTPGTAGDGTITSDMDVKTLRLCDSITQGTACSNEVTEGEGGVQTARTCVYKDERDLRYIVMY